jgi:hypothetical protein
LLLERGGLTDLWTEAWPRVISSDVTRQALERSANELPEASLALAHAAVAALHVADIGS